MKKIQSFLEKHMIIVYVITLALYIVFSKVPSVLAGIFSLDRENIVVYNLLQAVYLILYSILLFIIIKKCKFTKEAPRKNLCLCVLIGFPFLIDSIGYLLKLSMLPQTFYRVSGLGILSVVISNIAVGIEEEVQFRGLILPLMMRKYENKKHPYIKAVLFSSALFGITHLLVTLIIKTLVGETLTAIEWQSYIYQSFYATCGGVVFAAMTLYHNSLAPAIIWHSIVDICSRLYEGITIDSVYDIYVRPYDWVDVLHLNKIFPWQVGEIKVIAIIMYLVMLAYGIFLIYKLEKSAQAKLEES